MKTWTSGPRVGLASLASLMILLACSETPTDVSSTALLEVAPEPGVAGVDVAAAIEVRFDAPIAVATTYPIALQVGDCPGPVVMGQWARTADGLGLRFTPSQPLSSATRYTIHVGGGLRGADGAVVDLDRHGPALGGTWVTRAMVMGMTGMGMGMVQHSGPDWLYTNDMYGLAFSFTTGP